MMVLGGMVFGFGRQQSVGGLEIVRWGLAFRVQVLGRRRHRLTLGMTGIGSLHIFSAS